MTTENTEKQAIQDAYDLIYANRFKKGMETSATVMDGLLSILSQPSPVVPEVGSGETPEVREALGLADKAHERAATAFHPDPFDCALVRLASAIRSRAVTQGSEYDPERVKKLEKALRGVLRDIREGVTSEHRESALERLLS